MSARKAMNAACWNCKFYLVLLGSPVCCVTAKNVLILVMPMKCEKYKKEGKNGREG